MNSRMIITTTNSVEGREIDSYIDIISDRIVVGAGLFSELFAGFTDIVGGRSGKFEARMNELYNNLMSSLESQARKLRADAIIGLNIDMDEISGKSTQMFMISGVGTAVKLKKDNQQDEPEDYDSEVFITSQEVKINKLAKTSMRTLDLISELSKDANPDVAKMKSKILGLIEEAIDVGYSNYGFFVELTKLVILNMDDSEVISLLISYGSANYPNDFNAGLINAIQDILRADLTSKRTKNNWNYIVSNVDFTFIEKANFTNTINTINWEDYLFPILLKEVNIYYKSDMSLISEILQSLSNIKLIEPEIVKTKLWVCNRCGSKNSLSTEKCICQRDKFGLTADFKKTLEEITLNMQSVLECASIKAS